MAISRSLHKKKKTQQQSPMMTSSSSSTSSSRQRYNRIVKIALVLFVASVVFLLANSSNTWFAFSYPSGNPKVYTIQVVNVYPHDPDAFTQGLLYGGNDTLYESTGLYRKSSVRRVALQTGEVEAEQKMDNSQFGEGLTLQGERLYQVTWLQKTGFIYDKNNLSQLAKFTHEMQDGWGLATDGKIMFGSDGSSMLYQIDPHTMKVVKKQTVRSKGVEVNNINELEFVEGEVWANVWQTDCIARIAPESGTVSGWILLPSLREGLLKAGAKGIDVLNGIAWDASKHRIFVTGKLWPKLYEVKVHPVEEPSHYDIEQLCIRQPFHF